MLSDMTPPCMRSAKRRTRCAAVIPFSSSSSAASYLLRREERRGWREERAQVGERSGQGEEVG